MTKERLLILSRSIPQHRIGGLEVMTWDLAKAIVRQGVEVIVGTTEIVGAPATFEQDGVCVQAIAGAAAARYSARFWHGTKELFLDVRRDTTLGVLSVSAAGREVAKMTAERHQPIVLQAHGSSLGEIRTKWKTPSIKSVAGSVRNAVWLFKDRAVRARYDATVCVSETVKSELLHPLSRLGGKDRRIAVIENGIDQSLFSIDLDAREAIRAKLGWIGAPVIVCACRMHVEKGVAQLISSFALVLKRAPSVRMILVGDGPDRRRLESLVAELGIERTVHFAGGLSRHEVARYLNAGDVFAFLSMRAEGAPLNLLEAMGVGLPCVLSDHLLNRVPNRRAVWGVDALNAEEAADALMSALGHANEGSRSVLDAKQSIDYCAAQYIQLFQELRASNQFRAQQECRMESHHEM
ncbi:glycosyltransferase family 4 protein [Burkholderia vietnamiensis]|uniref:glycosyltransferase family 4 protein n=1 Tax=Burkholderia TaxID=32008 RepID=UPI0009BD6704|nr:MULTISPECIES: glycosyltransferase family 4 protein [Burkholderia]MBR8053807.1 glycosyltransferase family 4 protein [Burkholderia vietnamiensis]MCA8230335.1 glycosyltransferase family 4 protein [Burkholderia vietnamiensis]MDN7555233.1 glycosyltransferase family 4 protein [Burkholderia vietnamiensis]MDN7819821.1 glycosyltransferase family 4 protein [Burkholderia vietnamiensis]MDN8066389.1 glycosyltransferase family 4 protein [Burkholderia vietnamiensis]